MSDDLTRELFATTNARVWAARFRERFPDTVPDEGTMIGWFANAMEIARSAGLAASAEAIEGIDDEKAAVEAERDRLRAVVGAARTLLALHEDGRMVSALLDAKDYAELNAYGNRVHDATEQLRARLAGLDISEPMGGTGPVPDELRADLGWPNLPPHHVAAGEGVEGHLRRTAADSLVFDPNCPGCGGEGYPQHIPRRYGVQPCGCGRPASTTPEDGDE